MELNSVVRSDKVFFERFILFYLHRQSDYLGSNNGEGWEFFSSTPWPNRFWGPQSLLYNGYQGLLHGGKAVGA
jgi:hypothetical protein